MGSLHCRPPALQGQAARCPRWHPQNTNHGPPLSCRERGGGGGVGAGIQPPGLHAQAEPGRADRGGRPPARPAQPLGQPAGFWSDGWKAVLGGLVMDAFLMVPSSSLSPGDTETLSTAQVPGGSSPPAPSPAYPTSTAEPGLGRAPSARPGTGAVRHGTNRPTQGLPGAGW